MQRYKTIIADALLLLVALCLFSGIAFVLGAPTYGEELGLVPITHPTTGVFAVPEKSGKFGGLPNEHTSKTTWSVHQHSHTCPKCGTSWVHTDASSGSIPDHRCPKCGTLQFVQDARTVVRSPPKASSCPNGNCPVQFRRR